MSRNIPVRDRKNARMKRFKTLLNLIYQRVHSTAGPQHWWPCDRTVPDGGRDEIIIGAVLVQNTTWLNVVKSIDTLKSAELCSLSRLASTTPGRIAPHIRSSGCFNVKAGRLHAVARFFAPGGKQRFHQLEKWALPRLRQEMLAVHGVGNETADSILLYALGRPVFVIDAYTLRVGSRHGIFRAGTTYARAQELFTTCSPLDVEYYREYHALLVWIGSRFCKPRPRCQNCPLARQNCCHGRESWEKINKIKGT